MAFLWDDCYLRHMVVIGVGRFHLFLLQTTQDSLCMARFLRWHLSAEGTRVRHPEASISSPVLASSLASNALVVLPSSSSASFRAESNCSHSGLSGWVPSKAGHCAKAGLSKFISLSCCCMKNRLARLVIPHPQGDFWFMAGWAFATGAIAKAFR